MKAKTKNKLAKMQEVQAKKNTKERIKWIRKQLHYYACLTNTSVITGPYKEWVKPLSFQ